MWPVRAWPQYRHEGGVDLLTDSQFNKAYLRWPLFEGRWSNEIKGKNFHSGIGRADVWRCAERSRCTNSGNAWHDEIIHCVQYHIQQCKEREHQGPLHLAGAEPRQPPGTHGGSGNEGVRGGRKSQPGGHRLPEAQHAGGRFRTTVLDEDIQDVRREPACQLGL